MKSLSANKARAQVQLTNHRSQWLQMKSESLVSGSLIHISKRYKTKFNKNYNKILNWSTKNSNDFWDSIWDYCKVKGIKGKIKRIKSRKFYKNLFLSDYKLNFAENMIYGLLRIIVMLWGVVTQCPVNLQRVLVLKTIAPV